MIRMQRRDDMLWDVMDAHAFKTVNSRFRWDVLFKVWRDVVRSHLHPNFLRNALDHEPPSS